jgi:hypothetical protein
MRYELLEEVNRLRIEYEGPPLDASALGILQLQLQEIVDKVATELLARDRLLDPRDPRSRRRGVYGRSEERVVKIKVEQIQSGSLFQEVSFWVQSVLADPDMRSVLLGVASNIIYAISSSGVRGITRRIPIPRDLLPQRQSDFDVGANVRAIVQALSASGENHKARLRLIHRRGDETLEVELQID